MTRVAAIDCGTNSLRLLIADAPVQAAVADGGSADPAAAAGGGLTDVVRRMEIVRLGQGVDSTGRLAAEAIERTRLVLAEYAAQIGELDVERVRMVATSAIRDAENTDVFTGMVLETLGVAPEVVTGGQEALLSFAGAVRGLPAEVASPYLVVDIGGGSTEFVRGTSTVDGAVSMDIGCVRMTERLLHSDPPTAAEIVAAEEDITDAVDRALIAVSGYHAGTLVGLAGSVTTVTAIALGLDTYSAERIHHARVAYPDVAKVTGELLAATREERAAIGVMHPGRVDVIGAGALILRVLMQRLGAESVVASEHDTLDGIAWSLLSAPPTG